jgi:hypothetical protein
MAFIYQSGELTSFADYQDVLDLDQRIFEENEGLTDDIVDQALTRATDRLLDKIRGSDWWRTYYIRRSSASFNTVADIPAIDRDKILGRSDLFTEITVCLALSEYILPKIADFGDEANAERQKMGYYTMRTEKLYDELITAGDWYDFDGDSTVESAERSPGQVNLRRVR